MVKKILSTIILIMVICSIYIYEVNATLIDDSKNETQSQDSVNEVENETTNNNESENENTNTDNNDSGDNTEPDDSQDENDNTDNENSNGDKDTNTDTNTGNETDKDESNGEENKDEDDKDNSKDEDISKKPTQDNQNTSKNEVPTKSNDADLKELKIDIEGLTPDFNKDITEYYLVVDLSIEQIKVTAEAADTKAKVTVSGNKKLKEGENTININVKAEDGTTKKYYIYVTKIDDVEMANAELEDLEIEGFNIYPSFKFNIYSYNLTINEDIKNLNIVAKPQRENATVKIEGNDDLVEGENLIVITVTAEDETTVRKYKINTYINSNRVEIQEESKLPAIILLAILGTAIIGLGIFIVIKNRK